MLKRIGLGGAVVTVAAMMATVALAHISVTPGQTKKGAQETYTFNVPTEGAVKTVKVELEIPAGVEVSKPAKPTDYEIVEANRRPGLVRWTVDIPPGQAAKITLAVKNPTTGDRIQWKVHQVFADGTRTGWIGERGAPSPAPVTTLTD